MDPADELAGVIRPDFAFLKVVEERSGQAIRACFDCLKCSAGCLVAVDMDFPPHRIVRMVQLGLKHRVLESRAIWLCTDCMTCSDRCPNGVDVASVINSLRQISLAEGYAPGEARVAEFHQNFLKVVRRFGRVHELSLIGGLKMHSGYFLRDLGVGLGLLFRGKIPLLPRRVHGVRQLTAMFPSAKERGSDASDKGETG